MPVPHQPPNNIPLASSLPKVSFRKIPEQEANQLLIPAGVQDLQHINFGFNNGTEFEKPEHYLRYVEPIESELNKQVEYDMDEQDQEWLDALNVERRRDQMDTISYEVFEIIIDRLEKEWFDLMKRIPVKPAPIALGADGKPLGDSSEDIECAICDDGECENSNAIVFCDGCNLAVHQDCYGIPYIPEGQWLCRKCTVSPDRAISCVLCPHEGGAFKQTTQGKWAHLLCAMWIPETGVSNQVYMEPIDSVERIPKARWRLQCYLCKHKNGACIQCDKKNCFTAFHVTCARRASLLLKSQRQRVTHSQEVDSDDEESTDVLRAWCHKHVPKSVRAQRARQREEEDERDLFEDATSQPRSESPLRHGDHQHHRKSAATTPQATVVSTAPSRKKSARAYKKSYRAGPSLVPVYVLNRVLEHISRLHVRKKAQLAIQIAKFWSLKREARRGAPLLKRLHLEPWTASTSNKEQSDGERIQKLQFQLRLREDLEKVRMLAELVRKREKEKLRQVQLIRKTLIDAILFPYHDLLRKVLERVSSIDRTSLFLHPVSLQKVPDYYDVIKRPMDWTSISAKIDDLRYASVGEFKADVHLVLDNAMLYNSIDTHYHRTAARIKKVAEPIFDGLDQIHSFHGDDKDLQLEAEDDILALLEDYIGDDGQPGVSDCPNAIEELTRQYYTVDPVLDTTPVEQYGNVRGSAQARKASDRAARSDRSRVAAQRRREGRESGVAGEGRLKVEEREEEEEEEGNADEWEEQNSRQEGKGEASALKTSILSSRSKRSSALNASRAANEARRKRVSLKQAGGEVIKLPKYDDDDDDDEDEDVGDDTFSSKLEVSQVNSKDSFTLFNSGWVLPSGSKRSRVNLNSVAQGVPDQGTAHRETPPQDYSSELSESTEGECGNTSLPVRRAYNRKRKEKDDVVTSPFSRGGKFPEFTEVPPLASKRRKVNDGKERSKEVKKMKKKKKRKNIRGEMSPFTLCWAKVAGHSFYPAEIFDEQSDVVPENVRQEESTSAVRDGDGPLLLVRFFDEAKSFAWISSNRLKLLLENVELDQQMLRGCKKHDRKRVRDAFERAKAVKEA
ncbi:hypothetical protein CBS101457_004218 [Exobasidium rhododendri]|nr:hypothetical protein CBS101457_004218 [Exobasidium rhododendri]